MKYLLLICLEQPPDPPLETAEEIASWDDPAEEMPWVAENDRRGTRLLGSQVSNPANASTVRVRDGEVLIADGPYAETKEWMAGFDIIDCAGIDEAIEIAAAHPVAGFGMIEVRPFVPGTGRPRG